MPGHSRARREQGHLQNIANQLAQLTVGWQFFAEGVHFLEAPAEGVLILDLIANRADLNGRSVSSAMLDYGRDWLSAELMHLRRNRDWVQAASIEIRYRLRRTTDRDLWAAADLEAHARCASQAAEVHARFANSQVLSGREGGPISSLWSAVSHEIQDARNQVDWDAAEREPDRHDECLARVELFESMFRFLQRAGVASPALVHQAMVRLPTAADLQRARALVAAAQHQYGVAAERATKAGDEDAAHGNRRAEIVAGSLKAFVETIPCRSE